MPGRESGLQPNGNRQRVLSRWAAWSLLRKHLAVERRAGAGELTGDCEASGGRWRWTGRRERVREGEQPRFWRGRLAMEMTQARQVSGRADVLSNGPQLGRLWNRGGGRGAGLQSASSSRTLGCWCRLTESRRAAREKVERPGRGLAGPAGWRAVWKKAVAKGVHCRWELRGAQGGKGLRQSWDLGSTGTPLGRVKAGTAG